MSSSCVHHLHILNLVTYRGRFAVKSLATSSSKMEAFGNNKLCLATLAIMLVMTSFVEQGNGMTCGSTFFSALVQLIPCRASVAPFSPIPPTEACCNAIKILGQPCLCVLVNGPPISGVDRNMALQLPEKCTANFEPCEIM